jgi:hypothetical protein
MTNHKINVDESAEATAVVTPPYEKPRRDYKVVNTLFKRGKQYRKGSTIDLDEATAAAFLAAGDIKETKK